MYHMFFYFAVLHMLLAAPPTEEAKHEHYLFAASTASSVSLFLGILRNSSVTGVIMHVGWKGVVLHYQLNHTGALRLITVVDRKV